MTASSNHELKSFLGGYFHEDWELEASAPDEMIVKFLRDNLDSNNICRVVGQIHQYLDTTGDDMAIEQDLLKEFGCYYLPSADGLRSRDWLLHVARKLEGSQAG